MDPPRVSVRFRLIGPFGVSRDGRALADREVGSRKGRTLLKLLLLERGRLVPSDRIGEVLWGDSPPPRWERDLATLVSRLRAVFGPGAVAGGPSGYRFVLGERFEVDLEEAERLVRESEGRLASGEPALAVAAADRALEIVGRGMLLEDEPYAEWALSAREACGRLVRRARRTAWAAAEQLGDHAAAAAHAEAAVAADPLDEEAHRALMLALGRSGQVARALAAFEELRTVLADELGADPAPESRDLHAALLREEPLPAVPSRADATRATAPARMDTAPGPLPRDPVFVGREREVEELSGAWAEATRSRGGVVLLVGEAGMGKTRLALEAVRLAQGTGGLVLQARCYQAERSLFLQPVADAIRAVVVASTPDAVRTMAGASAGPLADLVPEIGQILRPIDYRPATPDIERRRMFEAIGSMLRSLSGERPALLFLDDLHDAGASTLELLHFVGRRLAGARVLVLATVRAEEGEEALAHLGDVARRLEVGPLPFAAVLALAERMGARHRAESLAARTRGHTLFVVESLRGMAEVEAADSPPPQSLVEAVLARVGRAGGEVEELLRSASILGSAFDLRTAAALIDLPLGEAVRRAERARRARLLAEAGPSLEFGNDLVREILYRTTPLATRTAGHALAADLLRDNPEAEAAHAAAAGLWARAMEAWLKAGERAAGRFANRDAESLLGRALEAARRAGDPGGEARARLDRGRAREALADYAGAYEDQWAAVERARAAGEPGVEMRALRELGGDVRVGIGRPTAECEPYLEAALALAERRDETEVQIDVLSRLAIVSANRLRFDLAYERARRGEALARGLGDERALGVALDGVKAAAAYSGDVPALEGVLPELMRILRGSGELFRLQWSLFESAIGPMARGEWDRALQRIDEAVAMNRQTGHTVYQPMFVATAGWIHRSRGDYGKALSVGREAVEAAGEFEHPWWTAFAETMLGWTLTELFALDEAVQHLERGLASAERDGAEGYLLRCLGHLALAAAMRGDTARAAEAAERAEEILSAVRAPAGGAFLHGAHATIAAARARLTMGDPARAERLAGGFLPAAKSAGWVEPLAEGALVVGRCALLLGRVEQAAGPLSRALGAATSVGLGRVAWEAHAALAEVRRLEGDGVGAAAHLESAHAIVEKLADSIGREGDRRRYLRFTAVPSAAPP